MPRGRIVVPSGYVLLPLLGLSWSGCTTSGMTANATPEPIRFVADASVDPDRAYLAYSDITSPVSAPQIPESLKPLSERSVEQIARAQRLMGEQRYTEAAIELERALRYDPNHPEIHRTLALLHWQAGNLQRAEIHAAEALKGNPDDARAHLLRGRCRARAGDPAGALESFRTALLCSGLDRMPATEILCRFYLAETLANEGYLTAALEQYERFEEQAGALPESAAADSGELAPLLEATKAPAAGPKAAILERLGRFAEAAEELRPLVEGEPHSTEQALRYARLLLRAGKTDQALAAAQGIEADDERVIKLVCDIHEASGHPERAANELRRRRARRPDEPRLVLSLADVLVRADKAAEATAELRTYLHGHPDDFEIRARTVALLIAQKAWDEALAVCAVGADVDPIGFAKIEPIFLQLAEHADAVTQLLSADPSADAEADPAAAYLRGTLARVARGDDEAEPWLALSLRARPEFVPARLALSELYIRSFRYDEAIKVAARSDPDVPDDARLEKILGWVYERLDDVEHAELHFKAAIQLQRTDTESMLGLAKIYDRSDRQLQAQRQLRVLLEEDPQHEDAREMLALLLLREGKIDAAYDQFIELRDRATNSITKARVAALLDPFPPRDPGAYRQALLKVVEEHGADVEVWLDIAETYDEFAHAEPMRDACAKALAIDPENERAAYGLAVAEQHLLHFEEAVQLIERLLPRRPNRHSWRDKLIDLYEAIGDTDAALEIARREASREDLDERVRTLYRLRWIDLLGSAGRRERAIELLKSWSDAAPEDWRWRIYLAQTYLQNDQAADAVPILEARFRADPTDQARDDLVKTLLAADRVAQAQQLALDWLYVDPDKDEATFLLATTLVRGEPSGDALELLRNRLHHTLHREAVQDRLVALLTELDRREEALDFIGTLLDTLVNAIRSMEEPDPNRPGGLGPEEERIYYPDDITSLPALYDRLGQLRHRFALILLISEAYQEAEDRLTSWLGVARDPAQRFDYLRLLAACYQGLGQDQQVVATMERALLLVPTFVGFNNDLAYTWIDQGVRLGEAEPMIRYALSQEPRQGAYLDTYGWLQYKQGNFAGARKWLERARRALAVEDPVVLDHLGDTCWRLGLKNEAIEHWKAAAALIHESEVGGLVGADARRARDVVPRKIEDAQAGQLPEVAPLAQPSTGADAGTGAPPKEND